ncbi:GGDEF domain-containing protein [Geothrix sp. PMB-07]|uniref:GGDEF domain-containing protein n=1 Tax=Geothrix sp. PMB-07 TaxID=3068640 RepID=UPI002741EC7F|nr:GGDEF domain-containing protein [Geothrix sp. PMB-07]WLT30610.1 GGDEF domain-containing protein [Geothrix sp. PMB-07]
MPRIHWLDVHPSVAGENLRAAFLKWGFDLAPGPGPGSIVLVAEHPDARLVPAEGTEILWWVEQADPEEVSAVLNLRPGWVLLQDRPLEAAREALQHIRQRDLGSEGWLRQMMHLASMDDLLRLVLGRAVRLSGAQGGAIWLRKDDTFYQRAGDGIFPEAPLPRQEAAELVRRGEAFLLAPSEQLGILRLAEPKEMSELFLHGFDDMEPLLLNAWRLEESRALSFKDDLTVAQNRRCLEAELPQSVRSAATKSEPLALLFIDVDDLKRVNTHHGHPAGSLLLETVARTAQRLCRAHDRLYRYGGDEFCILMPGTTSTGALKLGERLLQTVREQPLMFGEESLQVSLSAGVAAFPEHADGAGHLIEQADHALLRAKREGKGRVIVAG